MTQIPVAYVPLAPVQLVKPNGRIQPFGLGASTDSARGTALVSAVSAMGSGDQLYVNGPSNYALSTTLTLPASSSVIGIGRPLITATSMTDAVFAVVQDNVIVKGFDIVTNLLGVGKVTGVTSYDLFGVLIEDVKVTVTGTNGNGVSWTQLIGGGSTSHKLIVTIKDCDLTGGTTGGFGVIALLSADSVVTITDTNTNGETDGILMSGDSGATVYINGGRHLSTIDAVTSGGPVIFASAAYARGDINDFYSDGGTLYLSGCDFAGARTSGSPGLYVNVDGGYVKLDEAALLLPVANGGTGAGTLTGIVKGNGTSAMTAVTAPSGTIVGTTDTQTLTNKTLTSPVITGGTINNTPIGSTTQNTGQFTTIDGTSITATGSLLTETDVQILDATSLAFGSISLDAASFIFSSDIAAPVSVRVQDVFLWDSANDGYARITNSDTEYTFYDWDGVRCSINCGSLDTTGGSINVGAVACTTLSPTGAVTCNEAGADVDARIEGDTLTHMLFLDASASTENIALVASGAPNWQTMDRGLFIGDATTAPTGNPTSGNFLYSESGILKTRSSGGVTTSIGQTVKTISIGVIGPVTSLSTGDGKAYVVVPANMNGGVITRVHARVITAGTTGTTDIQIANVTDAVDVLSTKLTIDSTETGSDTAATAAVINTSNDDLATNDLLRIDVDAISTTAPLGLIVTIEVTL